MESERLDAADRLVIDTLLMSASGMSAEDLGSGLGLDKMLLFYQLDKLVKKGLLKRSRPMFREPELYEVTELGRERIEG
jgi:DNA-binding MarR family transcriptional regulator